MHVRAPSSKLGDSFEARVKLVQELSEIEVLNHDKQTKGHHSKTSAKGSMVGNGKHKHLVVDEGIHLSPGSSLYEQN
jgi:hypothetical protein